MTKPWRRWQTSRLAAQKDLGSNRSEELAGLDSLTYITEQDIAGRGVIRHDGKVARVLCYKFTTPKGSRDLLIHLTPEGLFTDMDVVGDPIPAP